jgi:Tropinone reductase 1
MTTTADRWKLTGKTALVTGATKGIGRAIADELLLLGARVCGVARAEDDVRAWERDCREAGHDAVGVAADMTEDDGRRRALDAVTGRFGGRLDILVNNVGTNVRKATLDYTDDEYGHVLRTNLDSVWSLCRAAHPLLRASGEASVVNISSVAGAVSVHSGLPYAVSKAALDQLTRYLAVEWAGDRIRVNAVAPWYTKTPLASPVLDKPEFTAGVLERTPLGRIADPEDVSGIAAFLCLPVASHITGQVVAVDGGFLAFGF